MPLLDPSTIHFRPTVIDSAWYTNQGKSLIRCAEAATTKMYTALEADDVKTASHWESIARDYSKAGFAHFTIAETLDSIEERTIEPALTLIENCAPAGLMRWEGSPLVTDQFYKSEDYEQMLAFADHCPLYDAAGERTGNILFFTTEREVVMGRAEDKFNDDIDGVSGGAA
jgi:hypothetical protein